MFHASCSMFHEYYWSSKNKKLSDSNKIGLNLYMDDNPSTCLYKYNDVIISSVLYRRNPIIDQDRREFNARETRRK